MDKKNYIVLKTDKELKILMSPVRQKIIKVMTREGKAVTSKFVADKLEISPSSAQHHIKKLEEVGIIEFDHNEIINGITARYLRITEKAISIGQDINDDLGEERDILARNILNMAYKGYKELINEDRQLILEEYKGNKVVDQLTGVVHLSTEEANELFDSIDDFIKKHSKASDNSHPYEYALIAYRADLKDKNGEV